MGIKIHILGSNIIDWGQISYFEVKYQILGSNIIDCDHISHFGVKYKILGSHITFWGFNIIFWGYHFSNFDHVCLLFNFDFIVLSSLVTGSPFNRVIL